MQVLKGRVEHRSPYSQQTPFNLLGASKCILSLDPWHKSWQKRNYLQLTDEEAETQLGPEVHKSQNLRAIKQQNYILDQELLNLSCCLFFTIHKLTIVFKFQSGYVSQYTAS